MSFPNSQRRDFGHLTRGETLNWGQILFYWAGDREFGGKSLAVINVNNAGEVVLVLSHKKFLSKDGSWENRVK